MNYPTLELDEVYFNGVLAGSITATIRIGERKNIEEGPLLFTASNAGYLPSLVMVEEIVRTTLLGISARDAQRAGYLDDEDARRVLGLKYPEANLDTPFTVIRFSRT